MTKESEWRSKLLDLEAQLNEERSECQNARDLLIAAQRDIEKLRQGVSDQLNSKGDELMKRDKEIEKLKAAIAAGEARLKDAQKEAQVGCQSKIVPCLWTHN